MVVDNASQVRPILPRELANGLRVEPLYLRRNAGAAARNAGAMASDPSCEWIVMLDDDSAPVGVGHLDALAGAEPAVAAVAAEIWLGDEHGGGRPRGREAGGLPEVFIGCGTAIRRSVYLHTGGYDAAFGYYAEEYDLAARILARGMAVVMDRRFQVLHRKVQGGRDMNVILERLVRNNGWVMQRFAPPRRRIGELARIVSRYETIARKEEALAGYGRGLGELMRTLSMQIRQPLDGLAWDRFTGKAAVRAGLLPELRRRRARSAAIIEEGKNNHIIRDVLREAGIREYLREQASDAEALIIGTLSPGPMLDALDRHRGDDRVVCPWQVDPAAASRPSVASAAAAA